MLNQEIVPQLKQFNEKADRLINLDFINLLLTTKPGVTVAAENERSESDGESIDEFVQVILFFMPDNEKTLFGKMSEVYSTLAGFEQEGANFENVSTEINSFLDSPSNMDVGGSFSKRELVEIYIHGHLSGEDEEKKKIYDKWISEEITEAIIVNRFIGILVKICEGLMYIRRINDAVITRLGS